MPLSRDEILGADDNSTVEVQVPEWGGSVLVRGMTGKERDEFEVSLGDPGRRGRPVVNLSNIRAKVIARCVVGEDGERLFTAADIAALGDKSAAAIDRVYAVAARLSGLSDNDLEEMAANFTRAAGNGSPTASPATSAKQSRGS